MNRLKLYGFIIAMGFALWNVNAAMDYSAKQIGIMVNGGR